MLGILEGKFKDEGWRVDTAVDGDEALKKIKNKKYDVLLLDLLMPKKNGFEVIERVRKNKLNSKAPIIVMSNLGDDDSVQKAISMGANEYFIKNQHPVGQIVERSEALASK